jgi:hypothetical protein
MIKAAKQKELDEEKQRAEYERAAAAARLQQQQPQWHPQLQQQQPHHLFGGGPPGPPSGGGFGGPPPARGGGPPPPPGGGFGGPMRYGAQPGGFAPPPMYGQALGGFSAPPPPQGGFASLVPMASAAAPPPPPPSNGEPTKSAEPAKPAEPTKPKLPGQDDFVDEEAAIDYTQVPAKIDAKFDKLDEDGAVRPTKVLPGDVWRKTFLKSLLAKPSQTSLGKDELRTEKNKAFDLLDALSKSGALPLGNCQLHVVILVTHCFDKTLMETVTRDNVNPIEKVERTQLIIASAVHDEVDVATLVRDNQVARVREFNGNLFQQQI